MTCPSILWIAVADGEHARILQPNARGVLQLVEAIDSLAAHLRASDTGSDRLGRSYGGQTPGSHGVEPRHDPHMLEKDLVKTPDGELAQHLHEWLGPVHRATV